MTITLTDRISYIHSCESPLSADVAIIKGDTKTYIFDAGYGEQYVNEINSIPGEKVIIISHFHKDHIGNLDNLSGIPCYVGSNTFKYSKRGNIVNSDIYIDDGIRLHIFPLPSSHAKGSLGLEVNEDIIFTGDAIGPAIKPDQLVYNVQILYEEIKTLEKLKGSKVIQSHHMNDMYEKTEILERLKNVYALRKENEAFVEVKRFKKY